MQLLERLAGGLGPGHVRVALDQVAETHDEAVAERDVAPPRRAAEPVGQLLRFERRRCHVYDRHVSSSPTPPGDHVTPDARWARRASGCAARVPGAGTASAVDGRRPRISIASTNSITPEAAAQAAMKTKLRSNASSTSV